MESVAVEILLLLFVVGLAAGWLDSIAGGGGLIALPSLLAVGLPPLDALGTTKMQGTFGTFTATINYGRKGQILYFELIGPVFFSFLGSAVGVYAVRQFPSDILMDLIALLLIIVGLYFALRKGLSDEDVKPRMRRLPFFFIFGFGLGFYDGFFGPGTGTFWTLAFVTLLGFGVLRAAANTKLMNFSSNLAGFVMFAGTGHVVFTYGLVMGIGQVIGAVVGSNMAIRGGAKFIRPVIVLVCFALVAKIVHDDPNNILRDAYERLTNF